MAGTNVIGFKDTNNSHDHTFYGNGCTNSWGDGGAGGSDHSCTTRILKTADSEDQKNGTYYAFQAATVGNGSTITTDNTNSPDTFCPLGWQMPYSGSGGDYYDKSKSFNYLFTRYGFGNNQQTATKMMSYPLSHVLPGLFGWDMSRLYYQDAIEFQGSLTVKNSGQFYRIEVSRNTVSNPILVTKLHSLTIRCVDYLVSHHRRHGGRKPCGSDSI